jgi:hypothetical protein
MGMESLGRELRWSDLAARSTRSEDDQNISVIAAAPLAAPG